MRTNTTSPLSFLQSLTTRFQPPAWVVDEGQQKLVLFLNHVLMQEKEAQNRLLRKKGSVVHVRWGVFALDLLITPAGLLDRAAPGAKHDLMLAIAAESPAVVMQSVLAGKAPPVKIEGDVQLAAELGWLADNLRWDVEEDLSRIIGDVPAHTLAGFARQAIAGLRQFLAQAPAPVVTPSAAVTVPPGTEPPKAAS
jgi:ubiquinone biosynthesis protein UbiJ